MKKYPDVGLLLELKSARRKRLARLSFEEKIAIVNKWRANKDHTNKLEQF